MSIQEGSRLQYLDLLRGIAVLGLLFMNMPGMGLPELGYVRFQPDLFSDQVITSIQAMFFDGRFRTLFGLLFGIGLFLQWQRFQQQGLNSKVLIKSRLNWLFAFGLLHCVFIWPGDILLLYALTGFYVYSKLNWQAERLLKRGIIFVGIGLLVMVMQSLLFTTFWPEPVTRSSLEFTDNLAILQMGYLSTLMYNAFFAVLFVITFPILVLFYVGGLMLLGAGLFKIGRLQHGFSRSELKVLAIVTLLVSGVGVYVSVFLPYVGQMWQDTISSISGLTMALLIWHLVLKFKLADSRAWLSVALQRTGRMAFTLYLMQSLVMASLFRYAFPEWNATFTLLNYTLIAIAFAAFQLVLANWYLAYYKQGPLEKLWRHLVNRNQQATKPACGPEQQSV